MKEDLQLFIIWNNGRRLEQEIMADISAKFEIIKICEVFWSKEHFSQNIARFYGKNLRKGRKKIRECGIGPFLAVIVHDPKPQYYEGKNFNTTSAKYHYRQLFGGGFMIHASDNYKEAFENFLLLTGESIAKWTPSSNSEYEQIRTDLIGTNGWQRIESLKRIISILPENELDMSTQTWTIRTADAEQTRRVLNAKRCWLGRRLYYAKINGQKQKIRICPSF